MMNFLIALLSNSLANVLKDKHIIMTTQKSNAIIAMGVHDSHFVTNISENVLSTHHSQIFYCRRQQSVFYYDDDRKQ